MIDIQYCFMLVSCDLSISVIFRFNLPELKVETIKIKINVCQVSVGNPFAGY
jgi:hypothetical protein